MCAAISDINKDLRLEAKAKDLDPKAKAKDLGPKAKAKDLGRKAKDSRFQRQFFTGLFTSFLTIMFCDFFYVRVLILVLTVSCLFMNKWIYYCYH